MNTRTKSSYRSGLAFASAALEHARNTRVGGGAHCARVNQNRSKSAAVDRDRLPQGLTLELVGSKPQVPPVNSAQFLVYFEPV